MNRLEGIDHAVQLTHIWINDLDQKLGWNNKPRAYRLLREVFHAVRDWLQVNEAVELAAQFPTFLRGVYFEQWRPATTPVRARSREDFIARIDEAFSSDPLEDTAAAIGAVFTLLSEKVTAGEISDVRHTLPKHLRELWRVEPAGSGKAA